VEKKEEKIKAMAELLLAKATMLQYHCQECGSPLFEKDGRVLCPSCGELGKKEEQAARKAKEKPRAKKSLQALLGKKICIKTESEVYRGLCEDVDEKTFSFTLSKAERLNPYGRTSKAEWSHLSDLLFIHGSKIEAAWLEKS
jgi:uncharacterized Zn finger protein (UPF0148 family)